jgi:outer membrane biosynthesis protein TonB
MRQFGTIAWLQPLRALSTGVLLVVLGLVLAACSAGSILTDSGLGSGGEPKGKSVPPVAIGEVRGIPPGKLGELKASLSAAGGLHDIGFVEGSFQSGVFGLTGNFKATSASSGVRVVYQWQFRDGDGVLIDSIDGEENAGVFSGPDPWDGVSAATLDRIARRTAETMARKLSAMGYAARLASLTAPPAELFAMASPDAHREIDFDTMHGPGMGEVGAAMMANANEVVIHEDIVPSVASVAPIKGEAQMPRVTLPEGPSAAPPPDVDDTTIAAVEEAPPPPKKKKAVEEPKKKPKPGQREIRAVAVVPVKGSPGGGDAELTAAMRKTLAAAGWPVVSKPQPDALTIVGRVKVAPKGEAQTVSVNWEVQSPDGKSLGDVKQANDVPQGALDQGWGPAAFAVAEAAATGIFDIVKRYR